MTTEIVPVSEIDAFDTLIDARTPSEYAVDHLPGAINCPVLDDEERARVGTIYKQVSPFEARRLGGALVARRIAEHLERRFADKPRHWRPLVYCWRGGQRSDAFVTWLRLIGWNAAQLAGGYKAFRRQVIAELTELPSRLRFIAIDGATGSGKTALLQALAAQGAPVLDLEALAHHRGSLLGQMPDGAPQPSQKHFETLLWQTLRHFISNHPVFVEAESRRIGTCHLPEGLWQALRQAPRVRLEVPFEERCQYLVSAYGFWREQPERLARQLVRLKGLVSNAQLGQWLLWALSGEIEPLFAELMCAHYDPCYARASRQAPAPRWTLRLDQLTPAVLEEAAQRLVAHAHTLAA